MKAVGTLRRRFFLGSPMTFVSCDPFGRPRCCSLGGILMLRTSVKKAQAR
jgi:hypothetical protein